MKTDICAVRNPSSRFLDYVKQRGIDFWGARIAMIPRTHKEVKMQLRERWEEGEQRAVLRLVELGFMACAIYLQFVLNQEIILEALLRLHCSRVPQNALCSIIYATRYKYFEEGELLSTVGRLAVLATR